ncbi:MAG: hypothetical protein M0P13_12480 [Fibrobacteraceae bacterium]|nr:hypothetical protein [Fibrobacteraceae bacterium]
MTLAIAWKRENRIGLIADSRFSINGKHQDYGIKLFEIPLRIKNTWNDFEYKEDIGLVFSGYAESGLLVKEIISQVGSRVRYQTNPNDPEPLSLKRLLEYFKEIVKTTPLAIFQGLGFTSNVSFFICGFCNKLGAQRLFQIDIKIKADADENSFSDCCINELLKEDQFGFVCIGDTNAINFFYEKMNSANTKGVGLVFSVLKEIIASDKFPSVGGNMQCGIISDKDFQICAFHKMTEDNPRINFLGFDFNNQLISQKFGEFTFSGPQIIDDFLDRN